MGYHHEDVYIGGYTHDVDSDTWYWQDGGSWDSDSDVWANDMPHDNSQKKCVMVHHEKDVKNKRCDEAFYYVCEIEL